MKKIIAILSIFVIIFSAVACANTKTEKIDVVKENKTYTVNEKEFKTDVISYNNKTYIAMEDVLKMMDKEMTEDNKVKDANHNPIITIEMENGKTLKAELFKDEAPITVANFVKLTKEGFYDGLTFHRIIPGFVAQGGDPKGNGTGGSKENIKGEFIKNGVDNTILHKKGVLSMARSAAPNSASSQFFIVLDDAPHLDGGYAAFGQVIEGMEVVDEMAKVKTDAMDKPLVEQKMKKVTVEEK